MPNRIYTAGEYELDEIFAAVRELKALREEINELFPEREFVIRQLELALLLRTNLLIFGTYGTGKSLLIKQYIECLGVAPDELFCIEMTRHTTESDLYGPINVPLLREEGIQRRNPLGTIRDAIIADLGELFDAPHLLRSLHGPLNERRYSRGADSHDIPLHTAVASTNIPPDELKKRYPDLDAAVDRFIFQSRVNWLENDASRLEMFRNYRAGRKPETRVSSEGLHKAAALIADATDQIPDTLLHHYNDIVRELREKWHEKGWPQHSDRAFNQWLEVMEANAVMHERYEVHPIDFRALRFAACHGGDAEQLEAFDSIVEPIIAKVTEELDTMSIDDAVRLAMQAVRGNIPNRPDDTTSPADLVAILRQLGGLQKTVEQMSPEMPATIADVDSLRDELARRSQEVERLIKGV